MKVSVLEDSSTSLTKTQFMAIRKAATVGDGSGVMLSHWYGHRIHRFVKAWKWRVGEDKLFLAKGVAKMMI